MLLQTMDCVKCASLGVVKFWSLGVVKFCMPTFGCELWNPGYNILVVKFWSLGVVKF